MKYQVNLTTEHGRSFEYFELTDPTQEDIKLAATEAVKKYFAKQADLYGAMPIPNVKAIKVYEFATGNNPGILVYTFTKFVETHRTVRFA